MAQLYSNENFPLEAVEELRRLGHDVLTTRDVGMDNQAIPDEDVLAFAVSQSRILLTYNRRDFINLHNKNADHAGIIVCRVHLDNRLLAARIDDELRRFVSLAGQLVRINRPPSP